MDASRWPIDVQTLVKGHEYDLCELGLIDKDDPRLELEVLALRDEVMRQIADKKLPISLRIVRGHYLRVMTDDEAVGYHDNRCNIAVRHLGRQVKMLRHHVDRSLLDDVGKELHMRALARRALQYQAARNPIPMRLRAKAQEREKRRLEHEHERPNPFKRQNESEK